jgi:hypothetical protein
MFDFDNASFLSRHEAWRSEGLPFSDELEHRGWCLVLVYLRQV